VAPNQKANIHFLIEGGMRIINYLQDFLHKQIVSAVRKV
jgi:hypothetical protein